jgi:signal transduction histidine kinase
VPVRVRVDGTRGDSVELSVQNGGAIAPEILPHLFEPFRRGNHRREGLGLGLYIVQQIAIAHQGSIEAKSSEDGTSFRVSIPRAER